MAGEDRLKFETVRVRYCKADRLDLLPLIFWRFRKIYYILASFDNFTGDCSLDR
jgi:hypothetical protein